MCSGVNVFKGSGNSRFFRPLRVSVSGRCGCAGINAYARNGDPC